MIFTIRLCILIVILGFLFSRAAFGQDRPGETHTFGYFPDEAGPFPEAIEGVVFRPDPEAEEVFILSLESSTDLEEWRNEGVQSYQVQDDGTVVVTGEEAIDRKFWRMRIMHPLSQDRSEWLALLQVHREETEVTARLTVRTNYHIYVENYVSSGLVGLPIPWEETVENQDAVNAAVEDAVGRVLEIVEGTPTAEGDYYEVTRPIPALE